MKFAPLLIAVAALSLVPACGKKTGAPGQTASMAAADINAASPLEKPYRVKGGKELDVDRLFDLLPAQLRPTYESSIFDRRSGATIVANLTFGVAGEEATTIKRAEFFGVDLDRIEKLRSVADKDPNAPLGVVVAKLRLYGVERLGDDGATMTIGALEFDSLRIREGGLAQTSPSSGIAAFFNAFDVAGVYVKDLQSRSGRPPDDQAPMLEFSTTDLRLVGLGGGALTALLARDLDYVVRTPQGATPNPPRGLGPAGDVLFHGPLRKFFAPGEQRTTIGKMEWRDISFAGLMAYGLKGERPPAAARNLINLGTARFVDTESFVGAKRFSSVPLTEISAMEFTWLAPSKLRVVARDGVYDFTAFVQDEEKEAMAALKSRKLDRVKADSDLAFDWSADRGNAAFSTSFESAGFADFEMKFALEGVALEKIEAARAVGASNPVAELGQLKSFSMTLVDEEMLDAFYALSAIEAGQSEKEIRAAMPTLMRLGKLELERKSPRLAGYVEAIADFLEEGGALEIKATPETPVPLKALGAASIGGPDAVATALDLTVEHKR